LLRFIKYLFPLVVISFLVSVGCNLSNDDDISVAITQFDADTHGWIGGFSNYPEGQESLYSLHVERTTLPQPLDTTQYAFQIRGDNRNDELFMFIKRRVRGLTPRKTYWVDFKVELATNIPEISNNQEETADSTVYLKAGATSVEPEPLITENGFYQMNIDKGDRSVDGEDMMVIGYANHSGIETVYRLIERTSSDPFEAVADENGILWLIIGTDTGFEGMTDLFYNKIEVIIY
jgi:hypothetical protein